MLAAILLLGLAASANAESPGLDQYVETIPGPGGPDPTEKDNDKDGGGGGGGNDDGSDDGGSTYSPTVDSTQLDALRSQGEEGERAAAALEATSRVRDDGKGDDSSSAGPPSHQGEPLDTDADGQAPVEAILSSMFGGGSGGILLPIIMLAVLVGGLVIAARTRRGPID